MSLQVWLPLNGNLDNYGLSNVSVTNSGATVNDSGKIGKCYAFNGSSSQITIGYLNGLSSEDKSVSMWVKPNGANNSNMLFRTERTSPGRFYFGIKNGTWNISFGSTSWGYTSAAVVDVDNWQHIVVTVKNNVASVYLNGEFSYSKSSTSFVFPSNLILSPSSYRFNGLMNDVRIYDHCLSPKEVKEISKGLVLHYKMDDVAILMSKCSNITWNQVFHISQWNLSNPITVSGVTMRRNGNDIVFSGKATADINRSNVFWWKGEVKDHKFIVRRKLKDKVTFVNNMYTGIALNSYTIQTGKTPSSDGQVVYVRIPNGTDFGDGESVCINLFDLTLMFGAGNEPTLEEFNKMFPNNYYNYDEGTIKNLKEPYQDESGYYNVSTIYGNLSLSSDTARYENSTMFNGTNYIYRPPLNCSSEVKTISFWANWDSIPSGQSVLFVDNGTKTGFGLMSTGILLTTSGAGSSHTYPKSFLTANTWYNFVIIITGTTTRDLYINGVKQTATSSSSNWSYTVNQLQIGKRSSTSDGFVGKMSDFRMYTTALSEDDIKELYDTAALIDNGHNLHCYEFVEDDVTSPMIEKNGLVKTNEFNEYPDDYIFYDYIESSGTQYIDTGINGFDNGDWEIYCKWMSVAAPPNNYGYIFGVYEGENYNSYRLIHKLTSTTEYYVSAKSKAGSSILLSNVALNAKHSIKIKNGTFIYNGVSYTAPTTGTSLPSTNTMLLFKSKKDQYSKCRIYSTWAKKDGILKYKMIPAKRKSDNEIGMYDMVTGRFFGNSGTGTFTTGTAIDVAAMYEQKIDLNQLLEI